MWQGAFTVARFVHHAGADRLMYGSNMYGTPTGHSPGENLSYVETAEISEGDKKKIRWENALKLFHL